VVVSLKIIIAGLTKIRREFEKAMWAKFRLPVTMIILFLLLGVTLTAVIPARDMLAARTQLFKPLDLNTVHRAELNPEAGMLPQEIYKIILHHLTAKELLSLSHTSRYFLQMIRDAEAGWQHVIANLDTIHKIVMDGQLALRPWMVTFLAKALPKWSLAGILSGQYFHENCEIGCAKIPGKLFSRAEDYQSLTSLTTCLK